jgi:hypothetical protein
MKTILERIAKKRITKWMPETTTKLWEQDLLATGWTKDGNTLTKGHHAFTFEPHGSKVAVSHRKLEVAES